MSKIITTIKGFSRSVACYSVMMTGAGFTETIYIGICPFSELNNMPDAMSNSEFAKFVKPDDRLTICLSGLFETIGEAIAYRETMFAMNKPHCNRNGHHVENTATSKGRGVKCIETQQTYINAAKAARAMGVTNSAMSQHLSGAIPTICGYKFERIT